MILCTFQVPTLYFATYLPSENTARKKVKLDQIEHFGLSKKAAMVSNFCLIGKIRHKNWAARLSCLFRPLIYTECYVECG